MPKKNTLIYIDDSLVSLAKQLKVNISETAETALREKMLPYMSMSEKMIVDVEGYVKDLIATKSAFFIPYLLKEVGVFNIGPIDHWMLDPVGGLNIIRGPNGSGKTTILKAIALFYGLYHPEKGNMLKMDEKEGIIQVKTDGTEMHYLLLNSANPNGTACRIGPSSGACLLLDDAIERLPKDKVGVFMSKLRDYWPSQIIMTTANQDFSYPEAKIFNLDGKPPLRRRSPKR